MINKQDSEEKPARRRTRRRTTAARDNTDTTAKRASVLSKKFSLTSFLPNITTLCALCIGLSSVRFALQQQWDWAIAAIIFAAIFDVMDGRLARYLGVTSRFGAELDSLSDFISFGASPTIILYLGSLQDWDGFGWFVGLCLSMCMALRLARFNTLSIEGTDEKWDESFFMGVPAPMAAFVALLPVVLQLRFDWEWLTHPIITTTFVLLASIGAVSRIPTFSTKKIYISRQHVLPLVLSVTLFIAALFADPWLVLSVIGMGYICTIPFSIKQFNKNKKSA